MAGQVRRARSRDLAARSASFPSSISPRSMVTSVMFVVITAVDGAPIRPIRASALDRHGADPQHAGDDHGRRSRVDARTGGNANRKEGTEEGELQQEQRSQRRDSRPLQPRRKESSQDERGDEDSAPRASAPARRRGRRRRARPGSRNSR